MNLWVHLPVLPVIVPLAAGAAMLLLKDTRRRTRQALGLASALIQLLVAVQLLRLAAGWAPHSWPQGISVYLLGDWPAQAGIVIVVDRLAAVMLTLCALLGCATLIYACARWDREGAHFHPLFQFLMMGINGAFLTGDLFNLFVFFEVLLAASYGLMLHGSGQARVGAGLHYIAINLLASFILLVAIALIYGVTGTLNMASLALAAGQLSGGDRHLFEAAAAMLGVAFLIKAGAWPLNFWLPAAYGEACAPVAAVFAIMTKVGVYALLRIGSLLLPTGAPAAFGGAWMFPAGLLTLLFGMFGLLAAHRGERIAAYCIIVSSGTLLAALGMPGVTLTGPALFYLVSSVLATGAFFMLVEMIGRTQSFGADMLAVSQEAFGLEDPNPGHSDDVVGVAIPAAMAFLGLAFISCALVIAGLPPLSGFLAKFSLLSAALDLSTSAFPVDAWLLLGAVLASSLAAIIALSRAGMHMFWSQEDIVVPRLRVSEAAPVAILVAACVALAVWAGPVQRMLDDTASSLDQPATYINAVLEQPSSRRGSP
ncbi:monovalent cation/H+ antiporter subunit D [Candidimonas nitroreducens]|uniref:Monovalent cation/H+ antiporter subunit D n=1 Tax=Candidimonas nitroreducens TaxID=683354 RepID=A0A225M0P0_9BURK|nr:monovalent cation/H+ antiporter subunit D [Candidimonas nitroreducens]OWT54746.1 monovalent cation/H+ antiporter subunit D [Candidimonas nitroreducens]